MVTRAYFARRFLALKLLRGALVAGALYDAGLAASLVGYAPLARPLAAEAAELTALGWLGALWLTMLAALALAAAQDIRRYSAVVATVIAGRAAAALVLATLGGGSAGWLAALNGLLAAVLGAAWWPVRR